MEPLLGQIVLFSGNFAPRGWAFCDGQLLQIESNEALFAILGTTYGGDGYATFGLPDLRGRVPVHAGSGPNLTPRKIGQKTGSERSVGATSEQTSFAASTKLTSVNTTACSVGHPDENMQPSLCINFIISLKGVFPKRN